MSDVRALLDDAAGPAARHPDPVGAVRTRVRRRAHRRNATLAAGATVAVAAGAVALPGRPARVVAPLASASSSASVEAAPSAPSDAWRRPPADVHVGEHDEAYGRVAALVQSHRDVFLTATVQGADGDLGWLLAVSLGSDVDPEAWRATVAASAGDMPWTFVRCAETTAHYDLVAQQVAAARWPSGATLVKTRALPAAVTYHPGCFVAADLTSGGGTPADVAYARGRWGDAVRVSSKPAP